MTEYKVYYNPDNTIKSEYWYLNDELHRDNDLPAKIYYFYDLYRENIEYETHKIEFYFQKEKMHREGDKPATIQYYRDGKIYKEKYYKNGKLHRDDDKPAIIQYSKSKYPYNILCEYWYKEGKLHREKDKPSYIEYFSRKEIKDENPNLLTNNFLPIIKIETYYLNGKEHRFGLDENFNCKPSHIQYYIDGSIDYEYHSIFGRDINSFKKYRKLFIIFRRKVKNYLYHKKKKCIELLKKSSISLENGLDVCKLITSFY